VSILWCCATHGRLTWAFLDTEGSIGVLGSGVVLQLERRGVVHERLRALGHARSAVVEIGAGLQAEDEGSQFPHISHTASEESITAAFHFFSFSDA